jgi:ABC-type dipeptide/oligopeptide/nickel transport system permease component
MQLVPGDPVRAFAPPDATKELIDAIRHEYGLDQPIMVQYFTWVRNLLQGNLGRSIVTRRPVIEEIKARYPDTLQLALLATIFGVLVGIPGGVISAVKNHTFIGNFFFAISLLGICIPYFWLGMILILVFSLNLGWLPSAGKGEFRHIILPAITLGSYSAGVLSRFVRTGLLDVLKSDYVRTARAKGLREFTVISSHALRNALIPVVTMIGILFGFAMAGTVVVETIFAYAGMGKLMVDSILARDYPMVQGAAIVTAATFLAVNFLTDMLYTILDPRTRAG